MPNHPSILAALLYIALPGSALAEDWKSVTSGDLGSDVDVASIIRDGAFRMFRLRLTRKDYGVVGIVLMTIDCKAQTYKLGPAKAFDGTGRVRETEDDPNAGPRPIDQSMRAIADFVCSK